MMPDETIKNSRELEFAVFCIENVAAKLGVDAERVYQAFTEKSDILNGYIVPEYEVLHTQSKEYIVDDLPLDVMRKEKLKSTLLIALFKVRNHPTKSKSDFTSDEIQPCYRMFCKRAGTFTGCCFGFLLPFQGLSLDSGWCVGYALHE